MTEPKDAKQEYHDTHDKRLDPDYDAAVQRVRRELLAASPAVPNYITRHPEDVRDTDADLKRLCTHGILKTLCSECAVAAQAPGTPHVYESGAKCWCGEGADHGEFFSALLRAFMKRWRWEVTQELVDALRGAFEDAKKKAPTPLTKELLAKLCSAVADELIDDPEKEGTETTWGRFAEKLADKLDRKVHRAWALDNVARRHRDQRRCGHELLTSGIDVGCIPCAIEMGRRVGHADAGAVYTHDEAMDRLARLAMEALDAYVPPQHAVHADEPTPAPSTSVQP